METSIIKRRFDDDLPMLVENEELGVILLATEYDKSTMVYSGVCLVSMNIKGSDSSVQVGEVLGWSSSNEFTKFLGEIILKQ